MVYEEILGEVLTQSMKIALALSLPAIVCSLVVGVIVALFSAVTQIQEQTLSFAPKMLAVYGILMATFSYAGSWLMQFTTQCLESFSLWR